RSGSARSGGLGIKQPVAASTEAKGRARVQVCMLPNPKRSAWSGQTRPTSADGQCSPDGGDDRPAVQARGHGIGQLRGASAEPALGSQPQGSSTEWLAPTKT